MEACYAKGGQGSRNSIPQIPVGQLAYQNCSRNNGTVACAGSKGWRTTPDYIGKNIEQAVRRRLRHIKAGFPPASQALAALRRRSRAASEDAQLRAKGATPLGQPEPKMQTG